MLDLTFIMIRYYFIKGFGFKQVLDLIPRFTVDLNFKTIISAQVEIIHVLSFLRYVNDENWFFG
jgi:hypothetical protein